MQATKMQHVSKILLNNSDNLSSESQLSGRLNTVDLLIRVVCLAPWTIPEWNNPERNLPKCKNPESNHKSA